MLLLNPLLVAQDAYKKDFPLLSKVYKFEKEPVGFTFVIDRSASLKKRIDNKSKSTYWDEIKTSVLKVIDMTKDGDYVILVGFDSKTGVLKAKDKAGKEFEIIPRTIKNQEEKSRLIEQLNQVGEPTGNFTNLYDSLDFVLEKCINRPGVQNIQVVFYFTDFQNDPPGKEKSEWGDPTKKQKLMEGLKGKYNNYVIKAGRYVNTFAFQLPLDQQAGRDFDEFSGIFEQNVNRIIVQDSKTLNEWFGTLKDTLLKERLRLQLTTNMNKAISIKSFELSESSIELKIVNQLPVEFQLKSLTLESKDNQKGKKDFENVLLKPNETKEIEVPTSLFTEGVETVLSKKISLEIEKVNFTISFDKKFSPEFAKLNMKTEQDIAVSTKQSLEISKGLPTYALWIIGILAIISLILTAVLIEDNTNTSTAFIGSFFGYDLYLMLNLYMSISSILVDFAPELFPPIWSINHSS
ncbi:MAG: VWA domain-containing protein [Chitinophagales bacterium]|nr:VWA domain-containing protein [Chitinophagales bacterium]